MRCSRGLARCALALAVPLFVAGQARAQLMVVPSPGDPPAVSRAELAYAEGEGQPVTWLSLRVERGPVAVVAALPTDARVDAGLDAWLSSLEATASPNVLLPPLASNCGKTDSFVHVAWPRGPLAEPTQLTLETRADVGTALEEYALPTPTAVPEAPRYVVWIWPATTGVRTTRTLRVLGSTAPLGLLPGPDFPLFVTSITRGAVALPTEASNQELSVTFTARTPPTCDYEERLRDWFRQRAEPLLEARARGPLFDWSLYADTVALGSLVFTYATRAAEELGAIDADDCARQLRGLRVRGAPTASACGEATDAALALGAAGPELPTLQRFAVTGSLGFTPTEVIPGGDLNPPLLRAERLDDSRCPGGAALPLPVSGSGSPQGAPSVPSSDGTTTVVVEETVVVDEGPGTEIGCGQSAPPPDEAYSGGDGCSSDPSSTSEPAADEADCGGDTTTSSDSEDSGCSSDTSTTTSNSEDSGCSSDTTSTDGESSGYDGDTCTGAAAPGAQRAEKARASLSVPTGSRRPARFRTSLWAVTFVALVLPIRRRKRGRRGGH